jgi:NAD-dependent SIR2 family protein deacetylase
MMSMDNMQFKSDTNEFECIECQDTIKVEYADPDKPRTVSCDKCGTEFDVLKRTSGPGLQILLKTASEPDEVSMHEAELEEEDVENPEEKE